MLNKVILSAVISAVSAQSIGQSLDITQGGEFNEVAVTQSGANSVIVNQDGLNGDVQINQAGDGNLVQVIQHYNYTNSADIPLVVNQAASSTNSSLLIAMGGDNNSLFLDQRRTIDSTLDVSVEGFSNTITANQADTDFGSVANVWATGEYNQMTVNQAGFNSQLLAFSGHSSTSSNTIVIDQRGSDSTVRTHHEGNSNLVTVDQNTADSRVDVGIFVYDGIDVIEDPYGANSNTVDIVQRGVANAADVSVVRYTDDPDSVAEGVTALVNQDGDSNSIFVTASGNGDIIDIYQRGSFNSLNLDAYNGSMNNLDIDQTGESSSLMVSVTGISNSLSINDKGTGNWTEVFQSGQNNSLTLNIIGTGMHNTINQSGMNNTASWTLNN